jgi:hypothetical protein
MGQSDVIVFRIAVSGVRVPGSIPDHPSRMETAFTNGHSRESDCFARLGIHQFTMVLFYDRRGVHAPGGFCVRADGNRPEARLR